MTEGSGGRAAPLKLPKWGRATSVAGSVRVVRMPQGGASELTLLGSGRRGEEGRRSRQRSRGTSGTLVAAKRLCTATRLPEAVSWESASLSAAS